MTHARLVQLSAAVICGCALSACSTPEYRYEPVVSAAAGTSATRGRAVYSEPPGASTGVVTVRSLGVVDIRPKETGAEVFPAIHLRLAISNQSGDTLWSMRAQDQRVSFANQGSVPPVFVNSDMSSLPNVVIRPRELRTFDFYFPLPEALKSSRDVREFVFHWQFQAGEKLVEENTPFDRVPVPESYAMVYPYEPYPYAPGWGPYWWGGGFGVGLRARAP